MSTEQTNVQVKENVAASSGETLSMVEISDDCDNAEATTGDAWARRSRHRFAARYSINWTRDAVNVYKWESQCQHHAIPCFAGYKKITGDGPKFVKVGPGAQLYGCFEDGAGRNFYGSHALEIIKL